MNHILVTLLGVFLTASCTGCVPWWKSPADLPSRITVGVSAETGVIVFEEPADNVVTAYVDEIEENTLQEYKINRLNVIDGDKVISTSGIHGDGKETITGVKFSGETGRKGTLFVEVFSSEDTKYRLKSNGWPFTVVKKEKLFYVSDTGTVLSLHVNCSPPAALIQVYYDDVNYGVFLCGTAIMLPKLAYSSVPLTFLWMDADGSILSQTDEVLRGEEN